MVYKRREDDTVLARFFIHGDSSDAIRFIKRKGKYYRIDDNSYKKIYRTTEITKEFIVTKIREAVEATLSGEGETYEIWINDYIHKDLLS